MAGRARRLLPVWLWLLAMLAGGIVALRTTYTADLSAFLPQAPTAEQQLLVGQLRDGLVSRLVLVALEGADGPARAAVSQGMGRRLRDDARFSAVANGEAAGSQRDQALLLQHRYALSPRVTDALFSTEGLRTAVADSIDQLAGSAGLLTKELLPRDPTGEVLALAGQLLESGQGGPASAHGVWASRDAQRAILLLQLRGTGADTDAQRAALDAVRAAHAAASAELPAGSARPALVLTGPSVFAVQSRERIEREVTRLSAAGMAVVVVLLLVLYRSLRVLALGLVPVLSGTLAGVVAVSLAFGNVHGLTLGFGSTLIGEAVDYAIYLFIQGGGAAAARSTWAERFWPTVRLGMLTSVVGFASLLFSGFPGLAQLGLYSVSGLLVAALVTRFVLPQLLPADFRVRDVARIGTATRRAAQWLPRLRVPALLLLVASVAVLVVQRDGLWDRNIGSLSPVPAADQAVDAQLRAELGAPDVRLLAVVSAPTQEAALLGAERAAPALDALVAQGALGGYDTAARLLPSQQQQAARRAAIPPPAELQARLQAALQDLPLQAQRLAPFLADAEAARTAPPLVRADWDGSALAAALDGLLVESASAPAAARWSALLPLRAPAGADAIDAGRVRAAIAASGNQALLVDLKTEVDALYDGYLREAAWLSAGGLAAIAVLLLVALRSPPRTLRVLAPLAGAVLLVLAGLALAGIGLTILHLVGLLLIVAVGSNYALFFDAPADPDDVRTDASLCIANATTVAGFGLLMFSSVPVLQAIGITVGPGAVLALLLAAVFARRVPA